RRKVEFDADAQPDPRINARRRTDRAVQEMLGLCKMCISDGRVTDEEARYLHQWVQANDDCLNDYVARAIADRLLMIFSDGRVDPEERTELEDLLTQAVGGSLSVVAGMNVPTSLPLDRPAPHLDFSGRNFVLTGKF